MTDIAARLGAVRGAIAAAAVAAGRAPTAVRLVAVSKGQPASAVEAAYVAGQRDFGESYAQELAAKRAALDALLPDLRWHFIGRVQRNKAAILALTSLVHGAASVEHARALGAQRAGAQPLPVLLQVNIAGEASKSGFTEDGLRTAARALLDVAGVDVRGLMVIPPDDGAARTWFARVRALAAELRTAHGAALPDLSMGMSGDFAAAIAEGATLVRVGTAIFGPRAG